MQNYHLGNVRVRDRAFYDIVTDGLTKQFERIKELNAPIEAAEQKVRNLQEAMLSKNLESETKSIAYEIESAKKFLNEERQKLINHLLDNEDDHILLEDRVLLNQQEQAELKSILEQKENIELEISKNQKILTGLKEKKSKIKQNIQKAKKDITREKHLNTLEELEKSIEFQASSLNAWKDKLIDEEERLTADAKAGLINRKYFFTEADSQRVKFKDPNATPKFRYVPESIEERRATAQHLRDTILGNTATHLNNTVLGNMFSNVVEKPTSTKARTVMLPAELFNEAGFLDNDLSKAISSYANAMGRHIALKRAFGNTLTKPGIEGILDALLKEKQEKNLELMDKYKDVAETDKKRIKAINKHEKEYQREVDFIKDVYNAYMGNIGNPKVRRITQSFKNHAAATLLGGVPLSQITDLGAIVFKHGLFPFMMEGLLPALKTLNGKMKGKDAEAIRENASHALVAIQNIASGAQDKFINDAMTDVPMYGRIGSFLDTAAHVSGNIYGTNHIENLNQTIVANMTQSKIMKAAFDVKNGTASEATIRKMAHIGIDIKKDAERFIAQYEQHGGWKQAQGYQSQYYNWSDVEAANTVSEAIYRSVYDTVVQRGMFSSPLWTNDPILGMIFTFHGWAYSAFTRYTIPALQRPDAQAAMGVATMFGLGLLIEPLRQYANGKEVKLSNNHMFLKALDNSGVLSAGSDMFNTLNLLMGKKLVPGMASERRKEVSVLGALAGPVGGNFEQGMALLQHLWTGKITQNDAKTGARLLGLNSHLLLRKHIDNFFKNTGLPEKSKDAEPWGWYSTLEDTLED